MKAELKILAEQINLKELNFAKFQIAFSDEENYISLKKGFKRMEIKYDFGSDTYIITEQIFNKKYGYGNGIDYKEEVLRNIYFDELIKHIESFFKFRYVMEELLRCKNGNNR